MESVINKNWIRRLEYAGYQIHLYPKRQTQKAMEFFLFDPTNKLTKETLWIPKSVIESKRDGIDYRGVGWIFDDYKNKEKLERAGYRV